MASYKLIVWATRDGFQKQIYDKCKDLKYMMMVVKSKDIILGCYTEVLSDQIPEIE